MSSALPFYIGPYVLKTSEFNWDYSMDDVDIDEDNIRKSLNKFITSMAVFTTIQVLKLFVSGSLERKTIGLTFYPLNASEVLRENSLGLVRNFEADPKIFKSIRS